MGYIAWKNHNNVMHADKPELYYECSKISNGIYTIVNEAGVLENWCPVSSIDIDVINMPDISNLPD